MQCRRYKAAYMLAAGRRRPAEVAAVLAGAEGAGQTAVTAICRRWLQRHAPQLLTRTADAPPPPGADSSASTGGGGGSDTAADLVSDDTSGGTPTASGTPTATGTPTASGTPATGTPTASGTPTQCR